MMTGIDPKIDFAFKRVFGHERNRDVLRHAINAVLAPYHAEPLTELELLNPFNEKETSTDNLSVADVKARDQLGRQFNVEMQLAPHRELPKRFLYYLVLKQAGPARAGAPAALAWEIVAAAYFLLGVTVVVLVVRRVLNAGCGRLADVCFGPGPAGHAARAGRAAVA